MTEQVLVSWRAGHNRYHTNPECNQLTDNHRPRDRAVAEAWGYSECAYCADEDEKARRGGGWGRPKPCPFCDEHVRRWDQHLPCDDAPTRPAGWDDV